MKANFVALNWDRDNDGWYVRIKREDGEIIDSIPPGSGDWTEKDITKEDSRDMIEASLGWENIEADDELIAYAISRRG